MISSLHLNLEFEFKCAVGFPGYFAGIIIGHYICLGLAIVVDSSFVPYHLILLCMPASASAERQLLLFECAICILDFASDVRSFAESSKHYFNCCKRPIH